MTKWNRITIHHTATPRATTLDTLTKYHVEQRGWSDIGYHWLILWDGELRYYSAVMGRPMYRTGAHAYRNNTGNVGIALVGMLERLPPPYEQVECAAELAAGLCASLNIPTSSIIAHREIRSTVCPGLVPMEQLRDMVRVLRRGKHPRAIDI